MGTLKPDILSDHLVQLDTRQAWALWRWVGLRSAGFPVEHLQALASPASVAASEKLFAAELAAEESKTRLLLTLKRRWESAEDESQRSRIKRVMQRVERGKTLSSLEGVFQDIGAELTAVLTTREAVSSAQAGFKQAIDADIIQAGRVLRRIGKDPLFREALLWQNKHALHTGVDVLLSRPGESSVRPSKDRQKEALITNYIQRYCAKNDTIGFFGPVGWAHIRDQEPVLISTPGAQLLAARNVYFEGWCIDMVAQSLASEEAFRPWLIPRRMPFIHVENTILFVPLARPISLSPAQNAILQACDGERSAYQIATDLLKARTPGISSHQAVYAELKELLARKRIAWQLEVSVENLYPERLLRQHLALVGDAQQRSEALAALAALETRKEEIAEAAGDVEKLEKALGNLEKTFTTITNSNTITRHAGEMYAGRVLVYEDCQRDITVELGHDFTQTLEPPLSLLLLSARWFTWEAARLYHQKFKEIYDDLVSSTGQTVISFSSFWMYVQDLLFGGKHPMFETLMSNLQTLWSGILALDTEQKQVVYQVEQLRPQVEECFKIPQSEWRVACYHSPDIMIAATSQEAMRAGDFLYVMGEVHPSANTLQSAFFGAQHPEPEELKQAITADRPQPRIILVPSREFGGATTRMSNGFVLPDDWRLVFAHDSCGVPSQQVVPIGSLKLEMLGERLMVSSAHLRRRWDIIEVMAGCITHQILHRFVLLPSAKHTPRILFDRMVVQRETWNFGIQEFEFAHIEDEAERFLAVQRWRKRYGLPRRLFLKTVEERKPQYIDLDSLLSVDVLSRILRRASQPDEVVVLSEMLPDLSQCWLQDSQGQHYTSELRLVVVDREAVLACALP